MLWALRNWQGLAAGVMIGIALAFPLGYIKGRTSAQITQLKDTVKANDTRNKIEDDVSRRGAERLCLDLGGLPNDCAKLRRMETPASR